MTSQSAAIQLVTARARSIAGGSYAALAVDGALAALVAGEDGATLRELAGLSKSSRDDDVVDLLDGALQEVGIATPIETADAEIVVLREMVSEVLAARVSLRTVTSWAHYVIGHDGASVAQPIVGLDDQADASGFVADADSRPILLAFLTASSPTLERLAETARHSSNT
jgi:hypothetical protein